MARSRRNVKTVNTGVSIEPKLLADGQKEAERRGMSFSSYVCKLIEVNLKQAKLERDPSVLERLDRLEAAIAKLHSRP